ncbi:MAG: methylglyoxal synthase [Anaerolineae bacterium]
MDFKILPMGVRKKIALIAHDSKKDDLLAWAKYNRQSLIQHDLYATGTTGWLLEHEIGLKIHRMQSGPLGGDVQIGAMIAEGKIDFIVFFWDPLEAQPHDPDVRALLRLAVLWNIPAATNRASADFMFSSPLMQTDYERVVPDYATYQRERELRLEQEVEQEMADSERAEKRAPEPSTGAGA